MRPSVTWKDKLTKKKLASATGQVLETMNFNVTPLATASSSAVNADEDEEPAVSFHLPTASASEQPYEWGVKRNIIRVFIPTFETWGDQQKFSGINAFII